MTSITKDELVYKTCLLLIQHFRNLIDGGKVGFNSRIFQHMLHWEFDFVGIGHSPEVTLESGIYPEHVVPCAVLINESCRLIEQERLSDEEIAKLLQKHWKIVRITPTQANYIDDSKKGLGYKSTMPSGWDFETGDTLARINEAEITIVSKS